MTREQLEVVIFLRFYKTQTFARLIIQKFRSLWAAFYDIKRAIFHLLRKFYLSNGMVILFDKYLLFTYSCMDT